MTTQIKAGVIAANAVNSSELASGALSGQNFTGDVTFDTTTLVVDSTNNLVGIGITPNEGKLHVKSDGAGEVELLTLENSTGTNGKTTLTFKTTSTDATKSAQIFAERVNASGHTDLAFRTYNGSTTERMRLTSTGLGIGTSPSSILDINANAPIITIESGDSQDSKILFVENGSNAVSIFYEGSAGAGTSNNLHIRSELSGSEANLVTVGLDGNVGIGTSNPSEVLTVAGHVDLINTAINLNFMETGVTDSNHRIRQNAGNLVIQKLSDDKGTATTRIHLDGGTGNIGIGTSSPSQLFHLRSTGDAAIKIEADSDNANEDDNAYIEFSQDGGLVTGYVGFDTNTNEFTINQKYGAELTFKTSDIERCRILSGGDVCIGKTTNDIDTQGFHVISAGTYSGTVYSGITGSTSGSTYHVRDTTNNAWKFYVTQAGVIHATSTSITSLSDERLKENIVDLETGLNEVMSLQPRRFDWKKGQGSGAKNVAGFIAQEVETVLPDLIDNFMHDDLEDAKSVKMGDMIPTLVKAIQEQQIIIDDLKSRLDEAGL